MTDDGRRTTDDARTVSRASRPDYSRSVQRADTLSMAQCPEGHFVYFSGAVLTARSLGFVSIQARCTQYSPESVTGHPHRSFSNAEIVEDAVDDLFRDGLAGDVAEGVQSGAKVDGDKV